MVTANETDQTEVLSPEAAQEESGCVHHWVPAPPDGPTSEGACRSCGKVRDFPNHIEADWGQTGRRRRRAAQDWRSLPTRPTGWR